MNKRKSRGMMQDKALFSITDSAAERIRHLMAQADKPVKGIRVSISKGGCSGYSYLVDYVEDEQSGDKLVEDKGVKVYIDPAATLYLVGTQMDYMDEIFSSGFTFSNPNETSRCGCGASFSV